MQERVWRRASECQKVICYSIEFIFVHLIENLNIRIFFWQVMIAPEDAKFANNTLKSREIVTVKHDDEDVERVRR